MAMAAEEQQCSGGGLPKIPRRDPIWKLCSSHERAPLAYEVYEAMRSAKDTWQAICNQQSLIIRRPAVRTRLGRWRGIHQQHMILAAASVGEKYMLPPEVSGRIM